MKAWILMVGALSGAALGDEERALLGKTLNAVVLSGPLNEAQRHNAEVFLSIRDLVGQKITRPAYVNYLMEHGQEEIATALQPFGYYHAQVALKRRTTGTRIALDYGVTLGPPVRIAKVTLELRGEAAKDPAFLALKAANPLHSGAVLLQARYEDYKAQWTSLAAARGYFDARFVANTILIDPERNRANITLVFDSGARYNFATVAFGHSPLSSAFLARYLPFYSGQPYQSASVAKLQNALQSSGYFQQVLLDPQPDAQNHRVPITAQLTMKKNKHYLLGLGYSTDEGPRAKFQFDWRWLNPQGHRLKTTVGWARKDANFDIFYKVPGKHPAQDFHYGRLGGEYQRGTGSTHRHLFVEGGYDFRRGKMAMRYSLTGSWEQFRLGNDEGRGLLLYPSAHWVYSSNPNRLDPEQGYQVALGVSGASPKLFSKVSFVKLDAQGRALVKLNERHRLKAKLNLGGIWSSDFHALPVNLRYFAGGDRSLRGYAFNSLGITDSSGTNIGGHYLATGSLEYEYFFKPDWAAAVFVDGGDAFSQHFAPKWGAGLGLHWRSPVGPIEIDLAHGFDRPNKRAVRLHVNIGTILDL